MMGISILSEQTLSQISKGDSLQDKGEHFVTFIIQTENNIHKRHKIAQLYFFLSVSLLKVVFKLSVYELHSLVRSLSTNAV